jgi:hypothetical protein
MSKQSGRAWSSVVATVLVGGSITLGACMPSNGTWQPPPTGTASGGTSTVGPVGTGGLVPGAGGSIGVGSGAGGTTCGDGMTAMQPKVAGGGIQPQIPATATRATGSVPSLSGGTLLALADGVTVVASDPDRDRVYVVDSAAGAVRASLDLQEGDEPGRLVEDGAGRVHVALRRGGALVTVDPRIGTLGARRSVCAAPRGIAYQKDGDRVHVACAGGELVSLPAAGGAAIQQLTLERDLRDVVVGKDGSLLVSTFRKAEVLVVSAYGAVSSRLQPGSGKVLNILRIEETRTPSVAWRMVPRDATTNSVLMLHQTGVTDTIDAAAGGYAGAKGCGGIVQTGVSVMTPGAVGPPVASGIPSVSLAIDVAVSPDGQKVAIAVAGNSGPQGPTLVEGPITTVVPSTPSPCGPPPPTPTTPPPGQVVAVSYSPTGVLFAQTREPAAIWRSGAATTISLASDSRADTGQLIFHANAGGGLACASCHPEGGEDGRVWNFACAGARRTQSMRGGISATAPFHWDGSERDFSHLMDDVFSGRMAGPVLTSDQKAALAGWVDTIAALPVAGGLDASAVARGKTVFEDPKVACATCHTGALLTNNQTVDVGTGLALQVPSLLGVSWRSPFMHTGCAATLADRFTSAACGGGDKHGVTSTLTKTELDDLTAYLQSL